MQALASALAAVSAEEVVEEKAANFAGFGLVPPYLTATLTLQDGKTRVLQFGDETPLGTGIYARLDNGPRLLLLTHRHEDIHR